MDALEKHLRLAHARIAFTQSAVALLAERLGMTEEVVKVIEGAAEVGIANLLARNRHDEAIEVSQQALEEFVQALRAIAASARSDRQPPE